MRGEITGISDSVPQKDLENKVVGIINAIGANVSNDDFQDCHRIEKSWNNSKKTSARFTDRKVVKDALYNRKKLKAIDKAALQMEKAMPFLNENLSEENNKTASLCRKLKRVGMIVNTYSVNGIIRLSCDVIYIQHDLFNVIWRVLFFVFKYYKSNLLIKLFLRLISIHLESTQVADYFDIYC